MADLVGLVSVLPGDPVDLLDTARNGDAAAVVVMMLRTRTLAGLTARHHVGGARRLRLRLGPAVKEEQNGGGKRRVKK